MLSSGQAELQVFWSGGCVWLWVDKLMLKLLLELELKLGLNTAFLVSG